MRRTDARDGMAYGTRAVGKMRLSTCCERTRTTNVTYRGAIQSIRRRHPQPSEHIWRTGAQLQSCRISQIRKVFLFFVLKRPRNPIKFWNLHADPGISTPTDPLPELTERRNAVSPFHVASRRALKGARRPSRQGSGRLDASHQGRHHRR